jgi:alpha-ketoglutarate-dependent taurine dioxygenase
MAPMQIQRVDATLGAVVTGVRLADLDDAAWTEIEHAFHEHAVLVFPEQHLTSEEQRAFGARFGDLEDLGTGPGYTPIANTRRDGAVRPADDPVLTILRGNEGWHTDSSYMPVAAKASMLSAHVVPSHGGHTEWADMRAAYDALTDEMKRTISTLSAHHSYIYSQSKMGEKVVVGSRYGFHDGPAPLRPLVKIHPATGRPSLFIGRHAYGIPGMSDEDADELLATLLDDACRPPRLYEHDWKVGDLVVWDNRCVLHRVQPWDWDEPRVMLHTRISGDPATEGS